VKKARKTKKIKVLGQTVTLSHIDGLKTDEDVRCWGLCLVQERMIFLDAGLTGEAYNRVLRHEIFHMKVGISGLTELLPDELEEALAVLAETD
jgi:hypothetical protein